MMDQHADDGVLVILGHGSSKHPDSSHSVRRHADLLQEMGDFSEVRVAFLKEEPYLEHCLDGLADRKALVIPDFLAEGYFTRQVIPAKLKKCDGWESVIYCPPVGTYPLMADLIAKAAEKLLGSWSMEQTSLLVVGHGSGKNPCSKQTLLTHLAAVRKRMRWHQVSDLWLEEEPYVKNWRQEALSEKVIVIPFLLNDGQHGGWDIPEDLGIKDCVNLHATTHMLGDYELRLAPALGTSSHFAEAIAAIARIWGSG